MRLFPLITIICSTLLLQGCLGAAVIGSAAVATKSATDPRSVGRQVDDGTLEARVSAAINKDQDITRNARIITTAYEGKILLTGQAPDLALAERAKQIATKVEGVEAVYNEIRQAMPVDLGTASKDTWITTKIKSQILTSDSVKSSTVKVITEAGEVFLLGILTQQEGAAAAKIASETDGVKRVTTAFTYLN
ncbi:MULTISPECIES: division/outer membrane stress-associated lipid-binding lipoprotein [Arsenophonus]|jgi:osmotically-inducible protein OsmY|uniref:Division/outer membrane stress-associated lipid-binding lipoprotein n=1 Tax=Arsenophonus apicola TaxID=2879119 RepID=A0ABY8P2S4_9GAMM|nr:MULTISPECIES: division/outer membrane stress-associated lipid-binding lipoprotein [Arsenophonus]UBX28835.1 divisome-associated lipoprotein YraP [Arsenophonus apicola]WGO83259.1 division/outer membrane stress-associated lipid-binding lipoprotein [Arsenophonus apicola]